MKFKFILICLGTLGLFQIQPILKFHAELWECAIMCDEY